MFRNGRHHERSRADNTIIPTAIRKQFLHANRSRLSRISAEFLTFSLRTSIFILIEFSLRSDLLPTIRRYLNGWWFNVNDSKLQRTFPPLCDSVWPVCVTVYNVRTLLRMETINYSSVVTAPVSRDASRQRSFKCNNRSAPFEPDVNALACEDS